MIASLLNIVGVKLDECQQLAATIGQVCETSEIVYLLEMISQLLDLVVKYNLPIF